MRKLIVFICLLMLMSCDPTHSIQFINNSNSELKVKFLIDTMIVKNRFAYNDIRIGDSIIYNINKKDTIDLYFGIGTWSDSELKNQIRKFKMLEIENLEIKYKLKSKKSIYNFLKKQERSGTGLVSNTKIIVEIK